ncbi:hypothetical protein PHMEG_0003680 [Phytophthora megakarya]|uniref:Uncharacterized protein n=1 Tax=Phytophthora megakarya TaxID=4795 RepID=A0A225WVV9_9STRA|nr:hypothetical protein PHMEG_0003680 [Phytophthora megakarya]
MGAEISRFLEQDALQSDNGVLLENELVPSDSSIPSVRRTSTDVANRSQIFAFCQHWDLVRVTEFLRWYSDIFKVTQKQTQEASEMIEITLSDTSDVRQQVDRLAKEVAVLEELLAQLEGEIESVTVENDDPEIPLEDGMEMEEIFDEEEIAPEREFLDRKLKMQSELREKAVALQDLKMHLLGSIDGVELREIVQWPLFVTAVSHVHFQETVRSSILSTTEWHPVCTGFAMVREAQAQAALDEYNKGDIWLPPPAKHEIDGHTDDSAESSVASGDKRPLSGEILINAESKPSNGRAKLEAIMKKPRVIKRSLPDLFDPSTRSPIFFGYSFEKQKNRVDEVLVRENALKTKEESIFEMKLQYQKDKLESTLASEKGKLQVLTQKESDLQVKREKLWAKRQADLDRAKKELDPNDIFFRTQESQDKKARDQEAFEDTELKRQKQNIEARMTAAQQESTKFLEQIATVRCTNKPLGDVRLIFHGEELERYEGEVNAAKSALATAQEEYAALATSKLRAPGQEAKLRSQVLFAEDQIKSRENELERICLLHESEQFLFERAQVMFDKEKLFASLFNHLNTGNSAIGSAKGADFVFQLIELAVAMLLGVGNCLLADKIAFLFDMFARKSGRSHFGESTSIRVLPIASLAEVVRVVFSVLSRIGDIRPPQILTRGFLQHFVEREFLKLNSLTDEDVGGVKERQGMTLHEFNNYCMETIEGSKYLCELLGHPWKYQQLSRFVVQHMNAIHQYRLGLINVNDLKYALARQLIQPREELSHWKKAIIHERALAMGENDPLKTDYSKYLPKRRAKLLSKVVPLDHGGYRNLLHYRMEVILRSAVKLQTSWRAKKGRQIARLAAEKQAFYHARGLALEDARQAVEMEWRDRDAKPAHSVDKMKFEGKIRMKQVKLRTKGNAFSREQVLALMTEEAVQATQKEVENRFREMEEELGYLKHAEALQLPHTEMEYLQPDIAKGLVTQLVHAKQESTYVGDMLESIDVNEERARQIAKAKKRKHDESIEPPVEVPETTDTVEEIEKHLIDKEASAARAFRTNERKANMLHGRFPPELYANGFTLDELSLQMTLAFPEPPLTQLRDRLKQVCDGMTEFKLVEFLQELPSKRHICDYVTAFRNHDGSYDMEAMETDLYDHFRIIRGSPQLAAALVNIAESDLEFGLTQKLLNTIQRESEHVLTQMVISENNKLANENAAVMTKRLIRMGYKNDIENKDNPETDDGEEIRPHVDPSSLFLQREKHTLELRKKKALEAHHRLVEAMKASKQNTQKSYKSAKTLLKRRVLWQ